MINKAGAGGIQCTNKNKIPPVSISKRKDSLNKTGAIIA